jgi:hypothetical protein
MKAVSVSIVVAVLILIALIPFVVVIARGLEALRGMLG